MNGSTRSTDTFGTGSTQRGLGTQRVGSEKNSPRGASSTSPMPLRRRGGARCVLLFWSRRFREQCTPYRY